MIEPDAEPEEFFSPLPVTPRVAAKHSPKTRTPPEDIFAKRPPTSPMPKITTKKPAPPARSRVRSDDSSPRGRPSAATSHNKKATVPAQTNPLVPAKKTKARRAASAGTNFKDTLNIQPIDVSADSPHIHRIRTLDAELRSAGDHLWDDSSTAHLEADVFQSRGANGSRGFLARGGGGGPPVYMGEGYVQGYEKETSRRT